MICKTCAWCADMGLNALSHTDTEPPEVNANWMGPMLWGERERVCGGPCPGPLHCDCQHKELKK